MGRTIPSYRMMLELERRRLKPFRDALLREERELFDEMLNQCFLYGMAGGAACRPVVLEAMIMSILFAHHKEMSRIEGILSVLDSAIRTIVNDRNAKGFRLAVVPSS